MSAFIPNTVKLAKLMGVSPKEFEIDFTTQVIANKENPREITVVISSTQLQVVGSTEVTAYRRNMKDVFSGVDVSLSLANLSADKRAKELAAELFTKYGLKLKPEDIYDEHITGSPFTLKMHPQSMDWYGQLTIELRD